ncbi:hypothetical protein DFH08DRAFT_999602 [Mycena albidolilacea]|uniref:Uncharacterized protein n=1 Tax=Mycena albidolilacea TaxID=1033008 RepID=A0AAD7A515_9AGAR|nr:hypothetical protein DFH08DRAFT_999602 [Mycena albidolilacea]
MTKTIPVCFEGLGDFTARRWRIPDYQGRFCALPPDTTSFFVPDTCFFINRAGDRIRQEIDFDDAKPWGLDDQHFTEIIYARASNNFCLRLVCNAEQIVTRNIESETYQTFARLVEDAKFYADNLEDVEGLFVPVHYGMWTMDTGDWAGKVVFSVTQYCGVSWNDLRQTKYNTQANRLLVGRTFERLHDHGVDHGDQFWHSDLRHVLLDVYAPGLSPADARDGKARCYIAGFSEARPNHQCQRRLPVVPHDAWLNKNEVGCSEIRSVLLLLDFMQMEKHDGETLASRALEWHVKYSELYPDVKNNLVLIAQRARFYSQFPPVYPLIHVDFESKEDLYCQADLWRDSLPGEETDEEEGEEEVSSTSDSASVKTASDQLEVATNNLKGAELCDAATVFAC